VHRSGEPSGVLVLERPEDPAVEDEPAVIEPAVEDRPAASPAGRARRIAVRVVVGFVLFLLVGNGLILGSTAYFRWTASPADTPEVAINNFRQIDDRVYRGAAPGKQGLRDLAAMGVTTIVDLRAEADLNVDEELLEELGLTRHHLPARDGQLPTEEQTAEFLDIVNASSGPVFLHCGAGVGRTGAMTAFYLNATGQAEGTAAMQRILSVGPPSLEQIAFSIETDGGEYRTPSTAVTAVSRVLDGPRRIWHNIT
jgi:protein tyrosine phosphatase (PTP) superfamily phosphohydrolase (DUF442 family)